jgi:hypothetical protein
MVDVGVSAISGTAKKYQNNDCSQPMMLSSRRLNGGPASLDDEVLGKWSVGHRFLIHPMMRHRRRSLYPFRAAQQGSLEQVQRFGTLTDRS